MITKPQSYTFNQYRKLTLTVTVLASVVNWIFGYILVIYYELIFNLLMSLNDHQSNDSYSICILATLIIHGFYSIISLPINLSILANTLELYVLPTKNI